jgi:hypothetical protein
MIGLRVMLLSTWLLDLLDTTLVQIVDSFGFHLQFPLSHNPVSVVVEAVHLYLQTAKLPPLPSRSR